MKKRNLKLVNQLFFPKLNLRWMSQITDMGFPPGPVVCSLFVDTTRNAMICWPSFDKQ